MINKEQKGGILTMNATRATAAATDGAVFGTTAETPPEDPPPECESQKITFRAIPSVGCS